MGYVIAAYLVVFGGLGAYWAHLAQERRELRKALAKCPSHEQKANPG